MRSMLTGLRAGAQKRMRGTLRSVGKNVFQLPGRSMEKGGSLDLRARRDVESILRSGRAIGVYFFEIVSFAAYSELYGDNVSSDILGFLQRELWALCDEFSLGDSLHLVQHEPGQAVVLCAVEGDMVQAMANNSLALRLKLKSQIKLESLRLTGRPLDVRAGHSLITRGTPDFDHTLYNAICEAMARAAKPQDGSGLELRREFDSILSAPAVQAVYQPIVDFTSGRVHAWEVLSRGPEDSYFSQPAMLFEFAEETGRLFDLEKACREMAFSNLGDVDPGQKVFFNIHPKTLADPLFTPGGTAGLVQHYGLDPADIVFEVTERHAIHDFTLFVRTMEHYRNQGFKVAVDNAGAGYNGLFSMAELKPEYIKLDQSLVHRVDQDAVRQTMVETLVSFAGKIGSVVVAGGIETEAEFNCLSGLGVLFGQGFFLGGPERPKPEKAVQLPPGLVRNERTDQGSVQCSIPVSKLARAAHSVYPGTKVSEIKNLLEGREPISAIVVVRDEVPVGLVMSHHMDRALSTRYGMSLYYNRDATRVMDASPLAVDGRTSVEQVARAAMEREQFKIYDHIIVTCDGRLSGIVSVRRILDTLASVQVEMAKGANPLSGLPGNVAIELEMEQRGESGEAFSIIYADLDNFKVYNDIYGFKDGDNIILLIARILNWAIRRHGAPDDFAGHVGGDDFVVITHPDRCERICRAVTRCFGRLVPYHYTREDRDKGFITGKARSGEISTFPLVSVSLAIVDCMGVCDLAAIGKRSAEMKKYAKSLKGNSYVRDRRAPLGTPDCRI